MTTTATPAILTADHSQNLITERAIKQEILDEALVYSYDSRAGLPPELQHVPDGPGFVITHFYADGRAVMQARPNNPEVGEDGKLKKYIFVKGCGSGPFITKGRLDKAKGRAKEAKIALIVEGTGQGHAAASWAPEDWLVIHIPGCYGGQHDKLYNDDWADLLPAGAKVYVAFDKDFSGENGNPRVWTAANRLQHHLKMIVDAPVQFLRLPKFDKDEKGGLDDYLATIPVLERTDCLRRLVKNMAGALGRCPKGQATQDGKAADLLHVDMAGGKIMSADPAGAGNALAGPSVVLSAAARIETVYHISNRLAPEERSYAEYDLAVALEVNGTVRNYVLKGLTDADLRDTRTWLSRVPGGQGSLVPSPAGVAGEKEVERAIRAASNPVMTQVDRNTGWTKDGEGRVVFLDSEKGIRSDDVTSSIRASIEDSKLRTLTFPDPHSLTREEKAAAIRSILDQHDLLVDPTGMIVATGLCSAATLGLPPRGVQVLYGKGGSGKTEVLLCAAAIYGLKQGKPLIGTFQGTAGATAALGNGAHNLLMMVDDLQHREHLGPGGAVDTNGKYDNITRRGFQGDTDMGRGRLNKNNASGKYTADTDDPAAPWFLLSAETRAIPLTATTSNQRVIGTRITAANSFQPGGVTKAHEINESGLPNRAWGVFIGELAKHIEAGFAGSIEDFTTAHKKEVAKLREDLTLNFPELTTPRQREVVSMPLYGFSAFLTIALSIGAIDAEEWQRRVDQATDLITAAEVAWSGMTEGNGAGGDPLLHLQGAVMSGKYVIEKSASFMWNQLTEPGQTRLGYMSHTNGKDVVVLIPKVAAGICRMSIGETRQALEDLFERDSKSQLANLTDPATKQKGRSWAIDAAVWGRPFAMIENENEPVREY